MRISEVVIPFPKKIRPSKPAVVADEPTEAGFLCVDLVTGKVLSQHSSLREAALAKRQWEQWGHKSVGIQEL